MGSYMKTTILLAFCIFLTFGKLYSQANQKLLFCSENGYQDLFVRKNNLQRIYIIYQGFFVLNGSSDFSKDLMKKSLDRIIPDKFQTGYATLDWEGVPYNILHGAKQVPKQVYNEVLNKFIATILYAKELRPNIRWSFYGMPTIPYMEYEEGNEEWAANLMPLLRNLDFFDPSLYLLNDRETFSETNTNFSSSSYLHYSLELAVIMNKPIFPFIWHRYSSNGALMSKELFRETMKDILSMQYQNRKVNGVVWWNCEPYLFDNKKDSKIISEEYKNVVDPAKYQIDLLQNYLNYIEPLIKNGG